MTATDTRPVLVTGGAGLLGRALVRRLLAAGRSVRTLDVAASPPVEGAEPILADVRDAAAVEDAVRDASAVVHLAAIVGVAEYLRRADEVLDVNLAGSRAVLEVAHRRTVPVLLASTSEVYGRNTEDLHEGSDAVYGPPSVPRWSYALSKAASEQRAFALASRGLRVAVVRYFNVYGPGLEPLGRERVMSRFLRAVLDGAPLRLVDGGRAVRSFCWVEDAAEATLAVLASLEAGGPAVGRALNVGRREPVTIRDLAARIVALSAHEAGVEEVEGVACFGEGFEEIPRRVPDVSALRDTVGYVAPTSLDAGLRAVLAHHGVLRAPEAAPPPPLVPMVRPRFAPDRRLLGELDDALCSGMVTNGGPRVEAFEAACAGWLGVEEAVAVSSGSSALLLAAHALGRGGKVVLPSFTYLATASAFAHRGLEPVFCDVDPETFTLDPAALATILAREPDVGVVVPVNVYGVAPDLEAIGALARAHGAAVVYDDSHGFGTDVEGVRCPRGIDAVTFSLHATKTLPAVEGGLVVAEDPALRATVRRLSRHGLAADPLASTPGYNARLDELRAAIGLHALRTFDEVLARRRRDAARLRAAAESTGGAVVPQRIPEGTRTSAQNLGLRFAGAGPEGLDRVVAALRARGVEGRRYFHPPLHRMAPWRGRFSLPVTERLEGELLCLPIHSRMPEEDVERVASALVEVAAEAMPGAGPGAARP